MSGVLGLSSSATCAISETMGNPGTTKLLLFGLEGGRVSVPAVAHRLLRVNAAMALAI